MSRWRYDFNDVKDLALNMKFTNFNSLVKYKLVKFTKKYKIYYVVQLWIIDAYIISDMSE